MAAHSRYWALLWPTYPAQPILSWLVTSVVNIALEFCWQTLNLWSKIVMLVLPQSIFSRFSFFPMPLHFPPVQPSGWAVKQETGAKSKFWCLDRTKGDLCGWAALLLFCHIAAGFKLLALLPTRLALSVKARPSHHSFYHYNVWSQPQTIIVITNLNATKCSLDSWQNSISPNSYFL